MSYYEVCPIPLDVAAAVRANVGVPVGVRIVLAITSEECSPEGNASAIDAETDAAILADIYAQLNAGNLWAWCLVRVTCTDGDAEGHAYLGMCSYADTAAFCENGTGYLHDLVAEAYAECQVEIDRLSEKYCPAA